MTATRPGEVSEREAEVLAALGARLSNAQIANSLHISIRTVESHVSSLLRKYGVTDRRALAAIAGQASAGQASAGQASAGQAPPPGQLAGLPTARTTFVGRERERDAVLAALDEARLVNLIGPGGVGKTRLATVVAAAAAPAFPFGGAFIDLVPVRDGFVAQAVAAALGVSERPQQPLDDAIVERLGRGRSLLVLDNCEHLLDAAAGFVERALSACPETTVLATSRERLGLPGERVLPIAPLPLASDAEVLFRDRATAMDPEFSAEPAVVAELCARLDGMPLAIELAAARSASLGAGGLLAALDDHLRLLAGGRGPDERHRSLRAVIGWSHDLLDEEERALFRRLAAFVGGFDLDAAVAVTPDGSGGAVADVLGWLVDKSLVVHLRTAGRWRLLETVRAFALDQLAAAGEQAEVRQRHLDWAAATAASLERRLERRPEDRLEGRPKGRLEGRPEDRLEGRPEDRLEGRPKGRPKGRPEGGPEGRPDGDWRDDFDAVADDLRAALAAAPPGPGEVPHRLARALGRLTYARRFLIESLRHYQEAADRAPDPGEAARDLRSAADGAHAITTSGQAFELLVASAERARAAGDGNARAVALAYAVVTADRFPSGFPTEVPHERLSALLAEAAAAGDPADPEVAAYLAAAAAWNAHGDKISPDPALSGAAAAAARATGDPVLISGGLDAVGTVAASAGRLREAHRIGSERLAMLATMPRNDPHSAAEIVDTFHVASTYAVAAGDLAAAMATARLVLHDDLLGDHPYLSTSKLVPPLVLTGELHEALRHAATMWDGWRRAGSPAAAWMAPAVSAVALGYGLLGEEERFGVWRARAVQVAGVAQAAQSRNLASFASFVDARVALHLGRLDGAAALVDAAFVDFQQGRHEAYARAAGAELAVVAGLPDAAGRLSSASAAAEQSDWAAACLARAAGRLHGDADVLTASVEAWQRMGARLERACTLLLLPARAAEGRDELAALGCPPPAC